jgi:hypothetical protein
VRYRKFISALIVGFAIALLTYAGMGEHLTPFFDKIFYGPLGRRISYVAFPGVIISVMTTGDIHGGSTWIAVLTNFIFYFGLTYVVFGIWKALRRDSQRNSSKSRGS